MADPDEGLRVIRRLETGEVYDKMQHHFMMARLASRRWERRRSHLRDQHSDPGNLHHACVNDLALRGFMDAFSFHQRAAVMCAAVAEVQIRVAELKL